jgi:hypothetical protein
MLELFADLDLSKEAAAYIAKGLRALADCDGTHANELALVEEFERGSDLPAGSADGFQVDGGGPLAGVQQKELFLRSLQLMALADGRISRAESEWLASVAGELDIDGDRQVELAVEAKKYLLASLSGVQAFYSQAYGIGRSLGLEDADIIEVLGPDPR